MNMMMKTMMKIPLPAHLEEAVCPLDPVVDLSTGLLSSQVVHWSLVDIGCLGFNQSVTFVKILIQMNVRLLYQQNYTNEYPNIFILICLTRMYV